MTTKKRKKSATRTLTQEEVAELTFFTTDGASLCFRSYEDGGLQVIIMSGGGIGVANEIELLQGEVGALIDFLGERAF